MSLIPDDMKLVFFYNGSYPEGMAMTRRLHCYARALVEQGVKLRVQIPGRAFVAPRQSYQGVTWGVIPSFIMGRSYPVRQLGSIFQAWKYAGYCYRWGREGALVFICGFGWWTTLWAILGCHLGGSGVVLEVNENPYAPEGGRLDPVWLRKLRRLITLNLVFPLTDGFVVISEELKTLVNRYRSQQAPVIKIPILVGNTPDEDSKITNNGSSGNGVPYMIHAGALSQTKDGILAVFEAFERVNRCQPLDIYLTQNQMRPELKTRIQQLLIRSGLVHRVHFTGHLSEQELVSLRKGSALAVINKPLNWQNRYNFPTKLAEYLADGVPIIVSKGGEMGRYLVDGHHAFVVEPDNVEQMAQRMLDILRSPQQAARMGAAGRELAKNTFYYKHYGASLFQFLKQVKASITGIQ